MRYLGIDYGEKRIGVALSDENGRMAFPHGVIANLGLTKTIKKIMKICRDNNVGKIIIGRSLNYQGESNPIMEEIEKFKRELEEKVGLPVDYENETLTTVEAGRALKGERARPPIQSQRKPTEKYFKMRRKIDASAAALILKAYLERAKK
ncbi:Holliday junction resolvase RuvX [Candidatus Parcubacteria bacterium]|nr:MAG: Holliday junction resolvase RuvX [Candidatus Parcubacteria bacterium]